jgi:hypothetical protein
METSRPRPSTMSRRICATAAWNCRIDSTWLVLRRPTQRRSHCVCYLQGFPCDQFPVTRGQWFGRQSIPWLCDKPTLLPSALLLHKKQRDTMTSSKRTWDSSEFRQYASYMSTYIVPHHTPGSVEPISWNEINGLLRNSNRLFCFAFSSPSKRLNEIASHQVDISTILLF